MPNTSENDYARQTVEHFLKLYEQSYELLLYYAALPLILTPELLHYLRHAFTPLTPWVAEVDILLNKSLCRQYNTYEQYLMHADIRAYLLKTARNRPDFRLADAARVLLHYIDNLQRTHSYKSTYEFRTQAWSAMVYIDDHHRKSVSEQIQAIFRQASQKQSNGSNDFISEVELARLVKITEDLAPQLMDYPELLQQAHDVTQLIKSKKDITVESNAFESNGIEEISTAIIESQIAKTIIRERIFICYSHHDKDWLERFMRMLKPAFNDDNALDIWSDTDIQPRDDWKKQFEDRLSAANIALLLVSPYFLNSEFTLSVELPAILYAATTRGLKIFWVTLSATTVAYTPIGKYQSCLSPEKPLDSLPPHEQNMAIRDVCYRISSQYYKLIHTSKQEVQETNIIKGIPTAPSERNQVLITCSHKDREWSERMLRMLRPLLRDNIITVWKDTPIKLGENWKSEIEQTLAKVKIVILLVSADYLASDFFHGKELSKILATAEQQELHIIWVCLNYCRIEETFLVRYQAAHDITTPLARLSNSQQNTILVGICNLIKTILKNNSESNYNKLGTDIFIAYSREDRDRVRPLVNVLQDFGWSVWWDFHIPVGQSFDEVINNALQEARSILVVWSEKSIKSNWVKVEAEEGRKRGILVSVRLDNIKPPMGFRQFQTADLYGWQGDKEAVAFQRLFAELKEVLRPIDDARQHIIQEKRTTSTLHKLRIFLSSPGDVFVERGLALEVLSRLQKEQRYDGRVLIEEVFWDDPSAPVPMAAHLTPQEAINQKRPIPSECEIVVVILWSRMGTPLPDVHRKPDGSPYMSGTEWEYEDALAAGKWVLLYRRTEKPQIYIDDPDFEEKRKQYQLVQQFFRRLHEVDGSLSGGYIDYQTVEEFEKRFRKDIEILLRQFV